MRTSNYTDFRKNLKKCLDSVVIDSDPLVINRGDKSAVVVISLEKYNSSWFLLQQWRILKEAARKYRMGKVL